MKLADTDKRKILDRVLPHLPSIKIAPKDIFDFPNAWGLRGEALDRFESQMKAQDAEKTYKAVDEHGNIYEMKNPWSTARRVTNAYGTQSVRRVEPKMVMTYEQALEAAKAGAASAPALQEVRRW